MTSHNPLLIITHLIAFFLPFLLLLNASPAPDPYPAVVSLPARAPPASRSVHQAQPTPQVEHDLLPFVLISTIDGALHAVDREKGKLRWTLKEGVSPLVGGGTKGKMGDEEYIVEPLSGSLFVFEEEQGAEGAPKVRKLPLSVEQLSVFGPHKEAKLISAGSRCPHSPSLTRPAEHLPAQSTLRCSRWICAPVTLSLVCHHCTTLRYLMMTACATMGRCSMISKASREPTGMSFLSEGRIIV